MTQEELQGIIDQLKKETATEKAVFGIFNYGGSNTESYIKADPEGLKLYAIELLKAAKEMENVVNDNNQNLIHFNLQNWLSEHSDTVIQFIEPANKLQPIVAKPTLPLSNNKNKEGILDKLLPTGCLLGLIILAIAAIIGLWTLGKWLF